MKRLTILILTITFALSLQGQPSPFAKTEGVKLVLVMRDCKACKPATLNEPISKYLFDKDGYNIIEYAMEGEKPSGKMIHNYQNGILLSTQNFNTWVSNST